jgi:hypothetical protein
VNTQKKRKGIDEVEASLEEKHKQKKAKLTKQNTTAMAAGTREGDPR